MPVSLFTKLETEFTSTGFEKRSAEAKAWFTLRVKELNGRINRRELLRDTRVQQRSTAIFGNMYMFAYDPKLKKELPYYDRFPLVIVIGPAPDGFLGLNLHYLQPKIRAKFLDKLLETISADVLTEKTRLKVRYKLLAGAKKYREFAPCLKHYLKDHMITRAAQVLAPDWETAIFLPTEHFKDAKNAEVWRDSRKQYLSI